MKTHLLREGKKPQFLLVEAGDITLTGKDIASLSHVLGKISPFADPNDYTNEKDNEEDGIWLSIITRLLEIENPLIRAALASNTSLPGWFLEEVRLSKPEYLSVLVNLAGNPNISPQTINAMQESFDRVPKALILANPATPNHILENAFQDKSNWEGLASNPALSNQYLEQIVSFVSSQGGKFYYKSIFTRLASNTSLPPDLMEKLAFSQEIQAALGTPDRVGEFHEAIARNPSTPEKVLRVFIKSRMALETIMKNPSTPHDILEYCIKNYRDYFWSPVLGNPSLDPEIIKEIYGKVKIKAFSYHSLTNDQARDLYHLLYYITTNPAAPPHIIEDIYKTLTVDMAAFPLPKDSPFQNVLKQIARNPSTPERILHDIVGRVKVISFEGELYNVARNPTTPVSLLQHLYDKNDEGIHEALAKNTRGFSQT